MIYWSDFEARHRVIDEETKQEKQVEILAGFKTVPVFGVECTEGEEIPKDQEILQWINALPLVEVARSWGLNVDSYNGQVGKALAIFAKIRRLAWVFRIFRLGRMS